MTTFHPATISTTTAKSLLPATAGQMSGVGSNFRAASRQIGSGGGGGETYLKINKTTGDVTFGAEGTPLPQDRRRFVVPLPLFLHGYTVNQGGKPVERHLVPIAANPNLPMPPGGTYAKYPADGPRKTIELTLSSIDEPGFNVVFTSWSVSHDNRLTKLCENIASQDESDAGRAGFMHPVILLTPSSYKNEFGTIHHFDYEILDWLHHDGVTFQSKVDPKTFKAFVQLDGSAGGGDGEDDDGASWDDGEDDEEMTEEDREAPQGLTAGIAAALRLNYEF